MILKNFIVFEGIDGAGTTTQLKKLTEFIPQDKLFITAEPSPCETGLFLRKILKGDIKLDPKTTAFLFAADRCEHLYGKNGVSEQTSEGKICVSDRYLFSSLAYQSVSCGEKLPKMLNSTFPLPEILFYFVIDPKISLSRVSSRGETTEIYEKLDYQIKTAECYEKIISEYEKEDNGMKVIRIDASKSIEEIYHIIKENLSYLI
ncbi:MAG: dTMP kinase [Treponema sp.]|nr:dTMP kinase [Treponema sp.]